MGSAEVRPARDVLADRIENWVADEAPYPYADRLIMDLYNEGYEIRSLSQDGYQQWRDDK